MVLIITPTVAQKANIAPRLSTLYLFIAIGALLVAAGGGLSRFGIDWALYIFELLGIAVMYIGFIKSEDVIKKCF